MVKPIYAGLFLVPSAVQQLEELSKKFALVHKPGETHMHHCTLAFLAREKNIESNPIWEWTQKYLGDVAYIYPEMLALDVKASCVVLESVLVWDEDNYVTDLPYLGKSQPHVTISCAEGVKPFYSNALINEGNLVSIPKGHWEGEIETRVGYFGVDQKVHFG